MICYNCGCNLPSDNEKECPLCGMKFPLTCLSCNFLNPLMANYCLNCGSEIIKYDNHSSINNYETLAESRKNVAVIFADVSGFTVLSEKMDPEEVREVINDTFNYITKPVYELEGTIDKYIGDCVMILFGAKYPHSDDPKRAVMCGMEMLKLIDEFSKERLAEKGITLDLSIGINYGLVVTGSIGNYFDKDYTVMGDIVNKAQRLQSAAKKGTILVSESVYIETNDTVEYSTVQEIYAKNKEKAIKSYIPFRFKTISDIEQMILVDRDLELNLMKSIFNDPNQTQWITVIGEAGIGKTSLIRSFVTDLPNEVKNVWVTCNSIYQNRVYFVMANILYQIMNIDSGENNSIKANRLKSYIDYIIEEYQYSEEDIKKNYYFLSLIMGLDRDSEFKSILNSMNYADIQREVMNQLAIFFTNLYKKYRFVVVVDDIQWADFTSLKILKELVAMLSEVKTVFIFASRYELAELTSENKMINKFKLNNLDEKGIYHLGCKLLQCNGLEDSLFHALVRFTNGNPLYVKEFITAIKRIDKLTIKNGIASLEASEFTIPNTIESLILANLSELDETTKSFLQIASVIGKEFNLSWIVNLLEKTFDDVKLLKLPLKLNILSLKSIHTFSGSVDKIYTFNQDTTREVIYDSLLNKAKLDYHKKIAEFIEIKYSNQIENYCDLLCTHYELAQIPNQAKEYYYKAASKYKKDFNFNNSLHYFNKFLDKTDLGSEAQSSDPKIVGSLGEIGNIHAVLTNYDKALESFNRALELATYSDDIYSIKLMIANIYRDTGRFNEALMLLNDIKPKIRQNSNIYGKLLQLNCSVLGIMGNPQALELAEKSEEILLKVKDFDNLAETMSQAGFFYFINGDIDNSLYYLNKAYQYASKVNNYKTLSKVSGNLGIIYHSVGRISKALYFFNDSIKIARKISNIQSYITGSINLGILYLEKGLFRKSQLLFKEALNNSKKSSSILNECITFTNLGDLMYEMQEYEKALHYYNQSNDLAVKHKLSVEEGVNYLGIVKLNLQQNSFVSVLALLDKAYQAFNDANEITYIVDYYKYKSIYELKNNNINTASEYCDQALAFAADSKNDMKRLKCLRLKGIIFIREDKPLEAIERLNESIILAEQLESDYELAKCFYRKYEALSNMQRYEEANDDLLSAKAAINKVDNSRWTLFILNRR